jgi:hypothetical protein
MKTKLIKNEFDVRGSPRSKRVKFYVLTIF